MALSFFHLYTSVLLLFINSILSRGVVFGFLLVYTEIVFNFIFLNFSSMLPSCFSVNGCTGHCLKGVFIWISFGLILFAIFAISCEILFKFLDAVNCFHKSNIISRFVNHLEYSLVGSIKLCNNNIEFT